MATPATRIPRRLVIVVGLALFELILSLGHVPLLLLD
jgi:hypothetical protein